MKQELTLKGSIRQYRLKGKITTLRMKALIKISQTIAFVVTEYSADLEEIHW